MSFSKDMGRKREVSTCNFLLSLKVFTGNRYATDIVKRSLAAPVSAKLIRFLPVDYHYYPTTRLEIYGIEGTKYSYCR